MMLIQTKENPRIGRRQSGARICGSGRRGLGLLVLLIMSVLLTAAILLYSNGFRVVSSIRNLRREISIEKARSVVMSALVEGRDQVLAQANQPQSAVFPLFRCGDAVDLTLPTDEAGELLQGSARVETHASFLVKRVFDLTPGEYAGIMRFDSTVTFPGPGGRSADKTFRITADHEFKVVNLAPPRPFGRIGVALAVATDLVGDRPSDLVLGPNQQIDQIDNLFARIQDELRERNTLRMFDALISEVGTAREDLGDARAAIDPSKSVFGDPMVRPGDMCLIVNSRGRTLPIDLESLDLGKWVRRESEAYDHAADRFAEESSKLERELRELNGITFMTRISSIEARARSTFAAAREVGQGARSLVTRVFAYEEQVRMISGDERSHWLETYWPRLLPNYWSRRAFYRVPQGVGLDRLPVQDGVFLLDGRRELVDVQLAGRCVLVLPEGGRVENLTRGTTEAGRSLLTLVTHGDLSLAGLVEATILAMPGESGKTIGIRIESGTVIRGGLILGPGARLLDGSASIEPDALADSGGHPTPLKLDRHVVAIAPEPVSQQVEET